MLSQSNPGAVVFSPQRVRKKSVSWRQTAIFEKFLVIHYVLECHAVHHSTLWYDELWLIE